MKRRVAFIDYFPTHYRRGLYEELARQMEVDFYFYSDERERWWNRKLPLVEGGDFRRIELTRVRIGRQAVMPGIALTLGSRRYDAVVKSLNGKLMFPLTYLTGLARGVPYVLWTGMWAHPDTSFHRLSKPLVEGTYRQVGAVVAYGDHVKRALMEVPGVDGDKIFVAGQAVDSTRFTSVDPGRDGEAKTAEILFVGQFEERKGLRDLLDAFEQLSDLRVKLRLIGNGSLEREVRARIGDRQDVELLGYVPQEALAAELGRARCLVLPSVATPIAPVEPWGLVVNEAMHAGLPVVATETVGAAAGGLVQSGRNGYVVPERDPRALADALRRLVSDPSLAAEMGSHGRGDVERFNYGRMADAFRQAVEHAIMTKRGNDRTARDVDRYEHPAAAR